VTVPMSPRAAQDCLLYDFGQASGIVIDCLSDSMQPVGQTLRDQSVILARLRQNVKQLHTVCYPR